MFLILQFCDVEIRVGCSRGAVQERLGERALIRIPAYMADAVTLHATTVEREVDELQRQKFPIFRAQFTCLQG